jgi:hypothetical protein
MSSTYGFPSNRSTLASRPFIRFSCKGKHATTIVLPIPGSLQFGDGATYNNNVELGALGSAVAGVASAASGANSFKGAGAAAAAQIANAYNTAKTELANSSISSIIQGVTALTGANETIQSAISIGTGTTLNKNISTEFTSTNTRVFTFAFQLIPSSTDEATAIRNIVNAFRINLYPEGGVFQLKYPPKWAIEFRRGGSGNVISDIPKIGPTYLTEVSTTFNSSANMWRADGSPIETSIQLQFVETQAYREDTIPK